MLAEFGKPLRQYAPGQDVPLVGYTATMATFAGLLGLAVFGITRKARWQPGAYDTALLGIATHKLARVITKDFVTAPLRAPFTERRGTEGAGEVHDEPRRGTASSSIGYLLTCPYCIGPWVATALGASLSVRPVPTLFVLRVLTAVTISDFLHLAYCRLNDSRKAVSAERRLAERS